MKNLKELTEQMNWKMVNISKSINVEVREAKAELENLRLEVKKADNMLNRLGEIPVDDLKKKVEKLEKLQNSIEKKEKARRQIQEIKDLI